MANKKNKVKFGLKNCIWHAGSDAWCGIAFP